MILYKPKQSHYDVIIVGSGPAGITAALEMAQYSSAKIAIIETGLLEVDEKIQTLSRVQLTGDLQDDYFPMHTRRCFGGSSTIWGGFCATLERRPFDAQSWPIAYEELERWYPAAARILELPENAHKKPVVALRGTSDIVYKPFYLSPPVRFNEKYHQILAGLTNVHLILGKTCTRLIKQENRIAAIELQDSLEVGAPRTLLSAEQFVLACGGVGNPRMLQLSNIATEMPVGLGLMEHPHLYGVAELYLNQDRLEEVAETKARVIHALQLSDAFCTENGILSFSADFNLATPVTGPLLGTKREMAFSAVSIRAEIAPNSDNRVILSRSGATDYLSQPMTQVDFHFRCEKLMYDTWAHFSRVLLQSGLGRPSTLAPVLKPDSGGHLIGTTPMGRSEANSVVDGNCKVHTIENLYLAGSSVFPAGGASNPTFTIVAMSLRLGDHLAKVMKGDTYG